MYGSMAEHLRNELESIRKAGLYKEERQILTPQRAALKTKEVGKGNPVSLRSLLVVTMRQARTREACRKGGLSTAAAPRRPAFAPPSDRRLVH